MNKIEQLIDTKTYLFQYATYDGTIYEDTGLITFQEAKSLRDKYFLRCKQKLQDGDKPQMCVRKDCKSETDYHTILKEINYYDCEIRGGIIYKVETKLTEISSDLEDLQSLQDTTEEKPTVATVLAYEQGYKEALSKVASILKKEKCIGIPYRNGIERGIEVAEELLANSV